MSRLTCRNIDVVDHFSTLVLAVCTASNIGAGSNDLKHVVLLHGDSRGRSKTNCHRHSRPALRFAIELKCPAHPCCEPSDDLVAYFQRYEAADGLRRISFNSGKVMESTQRLHFDGRSRKNQPPSRTPESTQCHSHALRIENSWDTNLTAPRPNDRRAWAMEERR